MQLAIQTPAIPALQATSLALALCAPARLCAALSAWQARRAAADSAGWRLAFENQRCEAQAGLVTWRSSFGT